MNNPKIIQKCDLPISIILLCHEFGRKNNKAQAIREMSDEELAAALNEIVAQQDNCPQTVSGWKEWLSEFIK
mgnify:CR=1 FL=1